MRQRSQDCIEHRIEVLAHVFGEEPQYEAAVFLQQEIFASVATVGLGVSQMLAAVELNGDACIGTQQIHFHASPPVKGNGQLGVETE